MKKVKLVQIMSAMSFQNEDIVTVLDTWDGSILSFSKGNNNIDIVYDKIDDGTYISIPCSYEIDNNSIIDDFILNNNLNIKSLDDNAKRYEFKQIVRDLDLDEKWNYFRNERYNEIASEWCNDNNLKFE